MWLQLFKSILGLFCGTTSTSTDQKPHQLQPQQQPGQSAPHWQQPQQYSPSVSTPQKYQDANQINQHNEHYVALRAQANEHGDLMAKCFRESHEAYSRGDGALAKELSNEGKDHQRKMEQLNKQASDFIFDSKPGEVDLHGLYVKEAIFRADQAIQQAKQRGQPQINFIVGKGLHSQGGVAKIKPAIEELIQRHNLVARIDPNNTGVLIVMLDSQPGQRGMGADEISHRLERNGESCIIM
ncbi:Smr domain-containing protein [Psilocybe cubensis]|uniref:Smr domain-containing protein n=1 Tax=Psilocybe cubensis TaxID=181762 RepID=A0ACB8HC96_PSICU|nr:Smr domain-containing protein [Psilocybe cubensis]KAH9485355.1 Smr domain-containing protein [Psilocybe cubensis]